MSEKTPHELLRESLERNAAEVAEWPSWLRSAVSTKSVFSFNPNTERSDRIEGRDAASVEDSGSSPSNQGK